MLFLHVSDLHIGLIDPNSPQFNAPVPGYSAYIERFKGQFGHHHLALQRLQEFYDKLVRSDEKVHLVMSGDATSFGKPQEFDNANSFLASRLRGIGLRIANWVLLSIPGNHDHWPGSPRILGRPTSGLAKYFPRRNFPRWTELDRLSPQHTVRFIHINTDADVYSYSRTRLYARGAFHNQIAALEQSLPNQVAGEIRVLLLHHSALYKPPTGKDLTMRSRSRDALESFVVNYGISVLMCGHTHAANVDLWVATASNELTRQVVECCCGTTTQRDRIPSTFRNLTGGFPSWTLDPNTLLVHRFEPTADGRMELASQAYVLTSVGFAPYGKSTRYVVSA